MWTLRSPLPGAETPSGKTWVMRGSRCAIGNALSTYGSCERAIWCTARLHLREIADSMEIAYVEGLFAAKDEDGEDIKQAYVRWFWRASHIRLPSV